MEDKTIKDVKNISISFIFLFVLSLPVFIVLYQAFGLIAMALFGLLPLGWFILDSEISHYDVDEYLNKIENH